MFLEFAPLLDRFSNHRMRIEKDVEVGAAQWQFGRKYFDICENGNVYAIVGKELYVFDETNAVIGTYKAKSDDGVDLAPSDVVSLLTTKRVL